VRKKNRWKGFAVVVVLLAVVVSAQQDEKPVQVVARQGVIGNASFASDAASLKGQIAIPIFEEDCF